MTSDISLVVLISTITVLIIAMLTIFLFAVFYKSKAKLLREKQLLESEVSKSQIEIREEFMRNVGKELHDNIGQVLSTVKLQLSMSSDRDKHEDSIALLGQSVADIRNLSKVVDPDAINSLGLIDSCKIEMDRLNRLPHMTANIDIVGTAFNLDKKVDIILFRMIQESINNSLKHSKTDKLDLTIVFDKPEIILTLRDYGVGFVSNKLDISKGSGLRNIKQRAEMIGASYTIESELNRGTNIEIIYKMHPNNEQIPNRYS